MKGARPILDLTSSSSSSESEGETRLLKPEDPPATWAAPRYSTSGKKRLSKQLSMKETIREAAWDRRTKQYRWNRILERRLGRSPGRKDEEDYDDEEEMETEEKEVARVKSLTDGDFDDLRGSIELGFGFSEEAGGHKLCHALPALDLYFAINRQLSDPKIGLSPSPVSTPSTSGGASSSSLVESPRSPTAHVTSSPSWRICSPGDDPRQVKTRLRHWAQAVACTLMIKNGPGGTPRLPGNVKE